MIPRGGTEYSGICIAISLKVRFLERLDVAVFVTDANRTAKSGCCMSISDLTNFQLMDLQKKVLATYIEGPPYPLP